MVAINVELTAEDLSDAIRSTGYTEALNFICSVDLAMADTEFTEALVVRLLKSLRHDYKTTADFDEAVSELLERV